MQLDASILKNDERAACLLRGLYRRFGYSHYKMSRFEEYSLYVRNKDFLVSDGIISFTDTNGRLLALKPDVTLSIINNSKDAPGKVQKLYYDENVYRISQSAHAYKEIRQTGLECIGAVGMAESCEVLFLAVRSLESISPSCILEVSHVGLFEAVLSAYALPADVEKKMVACISSKNGDDLLRLADEVGLPREKAEALSVFMRQFSTFAEAKEAISPLCESEEAKAQLSDFCGILSFLAEAGMEGRVRVDFSLSNNMRYYSGVAFRGYVEGIPTGVLSGGRYDKLMRKMGRSSAAVGFAVYLDALERWNLAEREYDVDVLLLHEGNVAAALAKAEELSAGGASVRVCERIPEEIRYKTLISMKEGGASK